MSHVSLTVVLNSGTKSTTPLSRKKAINDAGGLYHTASDYAKAARKLSKLPWVDRVVATHVTETNVGTWRKGRSS